MRGRGNDRWVRRGAVLMAVVLAACSGSGGESGSTDPSGSTVAAPDTPSTGSDPSSATTVLTESPTSTEPPPVIVPLGVRWDEIGIVAEAAGGGSAQTIRPDLLAVGGDLWLLNTLYNTTAVTRSRDGGVTWETVQVVAPPANGTLFLTDVVAGPTGRLVATGSIGSNCRSDQDLGNGYRSVELCRRFRPVLFASDDDGASWRRIEPAAMAPPGDSSVIVEDMTVFGDGYVAVGTVKGPDWHARVWASPDGETWNTERELRDVDGGPMSGRQVLTDGETLMLIADGHPCGTPFADTPSGWVLGTSWLRSLRMFTGAGIGDLTVLTSADHPFASDPVPVDCDTLSLSDIGDSNASLPQASGAVIGGTITLLEDIGPFDDEEDPEVIDQTTSGTRRFTQLIDGDWVLTVIDGVFSQNKVEANGSTLIDVDGLPGMFEVDTTGSGVEFVPILPDGAGSWRQTSPERSVLTSHRATVISGNWSNGALVAAGTVHSDPYRSDFGPANVTSMAVWRSVETQGDWVEPCDLGPGGVCRYTDLSTLDGYPDFAGIDVSGADLAYSDFGDADLTGANFTGATLWSVDSGDGAVFDGANFTGARLESARLNSAVGADFTGANAHLASIEDGTGATFAGTNLQSADLRFSTLPNLGTALIGSVALEQLPSDDPAVPHEISLVGLDLARVTITNVFDAPLLKVVSLDGSVFDFTIFYRVDLTGIDQAVIDLTEARVDDESLCPDGLPPDGGSLGTCVRGAGGS